nr:MAG TPA: hypothetical protein [Caudoviricetes sp.]
MNMSNENKSLAKNAKIHGVEIKKMPCGKYFEALQTLKNLPEDFIKELSDNKQDFKLSEMFTMGNIMTLITRLLIVMPNFTFEFLSKLMEIDKEILEDKLTPKQVLDIIQEFWRINELESFFDQMKPIMKKVILIGFKKQ